MYCFIELCSLCSRMYYPLFSWGSWGIWCPLVCRFSYGYGWVMFLGRGSGSNSSQRTHHCTIKWHCMVKLHLGQLRFLMVMDGIYFTAWRFTAFKFTVLLRKSICSCMRFIPLKVLNVKLLCNGEFYHILLIVWNIDWTPKKTKKALHTAVCLDPV